MEVNEQIREKGLINKHRARVVYSFNFFRTEVGKKIERAAFRYAPCVCPEKADSVFNLERVRVQLGHLRYNLTFEVNQSYHLIYGGLE
jgi:hypothetical protein